MVKIAVMLADGFEEVEGLTSIDLLRRAGLDVVMVSINDTIEVTGSHKVGFKADQTIADTNFDEFDMILLPGGMPGTLNLAKEPKLTEAILKFHADGKDLAAICAAPTVFGALGILEGKKACCSPGMEDGLKGAVKCTDTVVEDGNIITSRGVGTAIDFALRIITKYQGAAAADDMAEGIVYSR